VKKTFKVVKFDYNPKSFSYKDVYEKLDYEELTIEQRDPLPSEVIIEAINRFYENRMYKPEYLLLGWEIWLQLGFEIGRDHIVKPTEFYGCKIIVDELRKDTVQCIPQIDKVMFNVS